MGQTGRMRIAVVGHVEWVEFARVDHMPSAGEIAHAYGGWEEPAGGGAVGAVELARLGARVEFFTALGDDELGRLTEERLTALGVRVQVQVRDEPTRRALTLVDPTGERTIVTLGEKLRPAGPLTDLETFAAVDFVSGDAAALRSAREAPVVVAAARELATLRDARVRLDALVGSGTDPGERYTPGDLDPPPDVVITTLGARGGTVEPGGLTFDAAPLPGPLVDAYGCGDSFTAAFTFALAQGAQLPEALELAARSGAAALTRRGAHGS
jgi:ribokinase